MAAQRPARWSSKVRGLILGLALGDAIGSMGSDVPDRGSLPAGVATELAAWTVEGLLRTATRDGDRVLETDTNLILFAYQRWGMLRDVHARDPSGWFPVVDLGDTPTRGWLLDVPSMARRRGSSPATVAALRQAAPVPSRGCQGMLRCLPIAAYVGRAAKDRAVLEQVPVYAARVAALTHSHDDMRVATTAAVEFASRCLQTNALDSVLNSLRHGVGPFTREVQSAAGQALLAGASRPCEPDLLAALAPDRTAASALSGAVYVAASFPEADTVAEALEFAGWAPDGDSVAATAGAFLGALHGYEALPGTLLDRLDLGWVCDRLAGDLAVQVMRDQTGGGWQSPEGSEPRDPWWRVKYPGV